MAYNLSGYVTTGIVTKITSKVVTIYPDDEREREIWKYESGYGYRKVDGQRHSKVKNNRGILVLERADGRRVAQSPRTGG